MTESTKSLSPLRQRLIEDMRMRKLAVGTQSYYIQAVKNLARYLGRSPATASAEDLRRYQLYLVDRGISRSTVNRTITGLRFFFEVTLARDDALSEMKPVHEPRRLPLSVEEVTWLLETAPHVKAKAALAVAWPIGQGFGPEKWFTLKLAISTVNGW